MDTIGEYLKRAHPDLSKEKVGTQYETYKNEGRMKSYQLFEKIFNPKKDLIYYPCSASDLSPTATFGEKTVIHVEQTKGYVDALKAKGLKAEQADANNFNPGPVDILIMHSPEMSPEIPSSYVNEGGFILCDNRHATADYLNNHLKNKFKLLGVIKSLEDDIKLDTENLQDYFKDTEDAERIKRSRDSYEELGLHADLADIPREKEASGLDIFVFQKIKN